MKTPDFLDTFFPKNSRKLIPIYPSPNAKPAAGKAILLAIGIVMVKRDALAASQSTTWSQSTVTIEPAHPDVGPIKKATPLARLYVQIIETIGNKKEIKLD